MSDRSSDTQHGEAPGLPRSQVVSLFDPRLATERRHFLKQFFTVLALTTIFMWMMLPVYWGAYKQQPENLRRIKVAIIDLDSPACAVRGVTPIVGPTMLSAVSEINAGATHSEDRHLGWEFIPTAQFDLSGGIGGRQRGVNADEYAREKVQSEKYYAAIVINANATLAPFDTLAGLLAGAAPPTYSGLGTWSVYYSESRNFDTVDQWVAPALIEIVTLVSPIAAASFAREVTQKLAGLTTSAYAALDKRALASVLALPFAAETFNLRPLTQFAAIPATTIGQLYLLIFTYFVNLSFFNARAPLEKKIEVQALIALRIFVPMFEYFFISLSISLMALVFGVSFDRYYGRGGFVLYWMMNWVTEIALGMTIEVALTVLGSQFAAFFLIFFVITNVSVAFLDVVDQDAFYAYAFVTPVFNSVDAAKSVALGTKNHLVQNFAVNLGWCFIAGSLMAILTIRQRRRETRLRLEKDVKSE